MLCLFVRKIIRTGWLDVQLPSGRRHVLGEGPPLVAVRIAKSATVWKLLRNPELASGEAFIDGTLAVESGAIYDLLELVMAKLKMSSGPGPIRLQTQFRKPLRGVVQHNPVVTVAQQTVSVSHRRHLPTLIQVGSGH
ncbi:hypothetical protein [Sulfitobacter sp. M13]